MGGGQQYCDLCSSHDIQTPSLYSLNQALSSDPAHHRVISSSESGGPWGPRSNVDICVWDMTQPFGQNLVISMTVHREHALPTRKPLAICGSNVAVLTENYVMDLSVNSSTVVRVYNIKSALDGDRKANSRSMYRGSLTRGEPCLPMGSALTFHDIVSLCPRLISRWLLRPEL